MPGTEALRTWKAETSLTLDFADDRNLAGFPGFDVGWTEADDALLLRMQIACWMQAPCVDYARE